MKRKEMLAGLLIVILLAVVLIPFASQSPDGLEKVAADQGFASKESESPAVSSPFADYRIPGIGNKTLSTVVSGITGALAMFCIGWGIASLLKKWRSR